MYDNRTVNVMLIITVSVIIPTNQEATQSKSDQCSTNELLQLGCITGA
jgi:hypothetical protein